MCMYVWLSVKEKKRVKIRAGLKLEQVLVLYHNYGHFLVKNGTYSPAISPEVYP